MGIFDPIVAGLSERLVLQAAEESGQAASTVPDTAG